ncbi:hypothetical protein N7494_004770 [Penicillium frequentans]|uniref:Uncharacterized protein n=1 Tax=Penicillium frequentans TaxID=3151616 RepID=A0AAD6GGU6_9EURO|nr:hypothetical protein N7494_004770 [Penicillium glabrum]
MAALKYQSNRPSQQSVFPNDFTSKSTLENDRRKREAIAAAKLRESQAAETLERERREKEQAAALRIKNLEEKKAEVEHTRDEWMEKFNAKSAAYDARNSQLESLLEDQRNQKDAQINQLRNERSNIEHKVLDELQNEDVQILAIAYGTRIYFDSGTSDFTNMVPAFKIAARDGRSFRVCNELLHDDPNSGKFKVLIIVYRYNRPGTNRRVRTLTGGEGNEVRFDPWN